MECRVVRVSLVTRDHPGRGQRRHLQAEPDQRVAMRDEVIGIRHPVALDVGAVRVSRIGPPVVALGEVVVPPSRAARARRSRDRLRRLAKVPIGRAQDALALQRMKIEHRLCHPREQQTRRSDEKRPPCQTLHRPVPLGQFTAHYMARRTSARRHVMARRHVARCTIL